MKIKPLLNFTKCFLLLLFLFFFSILHSQDKIDSLSKSEIGYSNSVFHYNKPKPFSFLTNVPGDIFHVVKTPFQKQSLKADIAIVGLTSSLLRYDQSIINSVGRASQWMRLKPKIEFDQMTIKRQSLFKWPDNLNSGFYQLGEGATSMLIAGGFFLYGKIEKDNRALQTASDLTEAFLSMGITIQMLKRITGRQAPYRATAPGGKWHFFPSFSKYQKNTTNYDAFPSGHLATIMETVTVLAEDYPEVKWIRPVGYLLTGLTGWSMLNNKVHWASDFSLGLAIGYVSGKIVTHRHLKEETKRKLVEYAY